MKSRIEETAKDEEVTREGNRIASGHLRRSALLGTMALLAWATIVAVGRGWGLQLIEQGRKIVLFAPPVLGHHREAVPELVWLPALAAVLSIAALPVAAKRWAWWAAVAVTAASAATWWVCLALADGDHGLTRGLEWNREYADVVGAASVDPGSFLHDFVTALPDQSIQVRGHPPGFPLVLAALDRVGLSGPESAAAVVLLVAVTSVPASLIAVRDLAGEDTARGLAPFVAIAPAAVWMATSVDAFFVGITSWVVALLVLATSRGGRRSIAFACGAGVLAAFAALLSYGMVLMACVPIGVCWYRHRWRPLLVAGGLAFVLVVALVPLGFWWFAGLAATRQEYNELDVDRPYAYFFVNNLAAWALVLGPAWAVAVAWLRDKRVWALAGGGIAAAVIADLSGLSEGEVERIWLPFTIWAGTALAALAGPARMTRVWVSVQAMFTLVFFCLVGTYW